MSATAIAVLPDGRRNAVPYVGTTMRQPDGSTLFAHEIPGGPCAYLPEGWRIYAAIAYVYADEQEAGRWAERQIERRFGDAAVHVYNDLSPCGIAARRVTAYAAVDLAVVMRRRLTRGTGTSVTYDPEGRRIR